MRHTIENLLARANARAVEASSATSASRFFRTAAEAEDFFSRLRDKLLDIECWNEESEITSFELYDENGAAKSAARAAVGDYIKTVLPAAGKADWIKIVAINDAPDEFVLTVRPSNDPTDKTAEAAAATSHFFVAASTNNFCLQRVNTKINFYVIGLDERTNTDETGGIVETVRNVTMANVGYFLGVQKTQWQTFCNNFIEIEQSKKVKE